MNDLIQTLFSAWGDPLADGRAAKTDAAIGPDFTYADPNTPEPLTGRDSYLAHIAQFGEMMPKASARVVALSQHTGFARASVEFLNAGGQRMMLGQYFADMQNGKVTPLIGFSGTGEPD